ncbi:MAG: GNAT family N-acetyltransferase [Alphaproteobacteria bacterium]
MRRSKKPQHPRIRELAPRELAQLYPLIHQLNPSMTRAVFTRRLKAMRPLGYRAVAVFSGTQIIAVSGFWVRTRFWSGREFDIDNFIVDSAHRKKGIGELLYAWLEAQAKKEKAELIVLDSYVTSHWAHRFYLRQGFEITGYHLTKKYL